MLKQKRFSGGLTIVTFKGVYRNAKGGRKAPTFYSWGYSQTNGNNYRGRGVFPRSICISGLN